MTTNIPPFSSIPLQKDGPRGNAWGLFGENDQLGMLNRLTPETTLAATKEIVHGIRISTDLPLDFPHAPAFNRQEFHQHIHHKEPRTVNDDILTLNTQSSTQWDGFRHYGNQAEQVYFNGCKQDDIINSKRNGIHVWVENGGIIGRGVLLDWASWVESNPKSAKSSLLETGNIPASELQAVADSQNVKFQPGDILLIRTGFTKEYTAMAKNANDEKTYAAHGRIPTIGLESSEATVKWIWENGFAAVAGDQPGFEALPFQSTEWCLHEWLLAGWGLPIGELFHLEKLAEECSRLKKWSFFFSSMPLNVPGGVASPPNGVAIL